MNPVEPEAWQKQHSEHESVISLNRYSFENNHDDSHFYFLLLLMTLQGHVICYVYEEVKLSDLDCEHHVLSRYSNIVVYMIVHVLDLYQVVEIFPSRNRF